MNFDMKTIIVKSSNWKTEIEINSDIFDDPIIEGCTQVLETLNKDKTHGLNSISVAIQGCIKGETEDSPIVYNTYKLLMNGGMYVKAKILRDSFFSEYKIDLEKEPIQSRVSLK